MSIKVLYNVMRNRCQCHPETCCCPPYCVVRPDGSKMVSLNSLPIAEEIADALCVYHGLKPVPQR